MTNYYYSEESDTLVLVVEGMLIIDVILEHYNEIQNNDSLPRDLKVLIDCRTAVFNIEAQSLEVTFDIIKTLIQKYDSIKEAIIIESPIGAAIATLFAKLNSEFENYTFRVFSTEEASKKWLES